jgi:hypothetical protein
MHPVLTYDALDTLIAHVRLRQLLHLTVLLAHLSNVNDALLPDNPLHHAQIILVYSRGLALFLMVMQTLTNTCIWVPGNVIFLPGRLAVHSFLN